MPTGCFAEAAALGGLKLWFLAKAEAEPGEKAPTSAGKRRRKSALISNNAAKVILDTTIYLQKIGADTAEKGPPHDIRADPNQPNYAYYA